MAEGLFGGIAEGLSSAQQQRLQQQQQEQQYALGNQRLQLEQQRMQNEQRRELMAQADKDISTGMDAVTKIIEAGKAKGTDISQIYKTIEPMLGQIKQLASTAGRKNASAFIDAQVASAVAQPSANDLLGPPSGSSSNLAARGPSDVPAQPSGTGPRPSGQNLTDQNIVNVEPQQNEVDRLTRALMMLPKDANPNMVAAVKARLQNAIQINTPDATVHFAHVPGAPDVPLVITKQGGKVSITDTKGNPYVSPIENGEKTRPQKIGDAIISGDQPPVIKGLYRDTAAVEEYLSDKHFNLTQAQLEWQAAQKQVQSVNGPQMVRYAGLIKDVDSTINRVQELSHQLQNIGVPLLNKAKLQTLIETQGNTEKGKLATAYMTQIGVLKETFANLANGGYAPTEPAWGLANKQINGNYGVDQLDASLGEVQRAIRYRIQAIPNFQTLGPDAANRYKPGGGKTSEGEGSSSKPSIPPPPAGFVVTGQ